MEKKQNIVKLISRLWSYIKPNRRKQIFPLIILALLASFSEILSIGIILPFLTFISSPEIFFNYPLVKSLFEFLGLKDLADLIPLFIIFFIFIVIVTSALRLLLLYANTRFSFSVGSDLSLEMYRRTIYQPYIVHSSRNSSEVINGILGKSIGVISSIILPILTFATSSLLILAITGALLLINPRITIEIFAFFAIFYGISIYLARQKLFINSQKIANDSTFLIKHLQESLGGIRDILIDNSQEMYCSIFKNRDSSLRVAQGNSLFLAAIPRYIIETVVMVFIAAFSFLILSQGGNLNQAIPLIGVFLISAQRLLPLLQQIFSSWASIQGGRVSLADALNLLDQKLPIDFYKKSIKALPFKKNIILKNIHFRYHVNSSFVLKDVNLKITRGSRVGIIGTTGAGKSTLINIIMGLIIPTKGSLSIDNKAIKTSNQNAWRKHIAHVPQDIFLADSSIEENIAFGVEPKEINPEKVRLAAKQAHLSHTIEAWPKSYKTLVGERGVRLSGGQRQRVAIARALYKNADVIVFDEATSALDTKTETAVIKSIESLNKNITLFIVAHRLSTLRKCTHLIEIEGMTIKKVTIVK